MIVHLHDQIEQGHSKLAIRTVDTDVVVLAVTAIATFSDCELWIIFGVGKHLKYLPAHLYAEILGSRRCSTLPALTGCDTTSFFHGIGKKTAWDIWSTYDSLTGALEEMMSLHTSDEEEISVESLSILERFTVLLYDRTSTSSEVSKCDLKLIVS